jgi:hypothetical protein
MTKKPKALTTGKINLSFLMDSVNGSKSSTV